MSCADLSSHSRLTPLQNIPFAYYAALPSFCVNGFYDTDNICHRNWCLTFICIVARCFTGREMGKLHDYHNYSFFSPLLHVD